MKPQTFIPFVLICITAASAFSQGQTGEVLVTGKGIRITAGDLMPRTKAVYDSVASSIAAARSQILSAYLAEQLLDTEAKARGISVEALEREALAKVPDPSAEVIQQVYDANRAALGNKPLAEIRQLIVDYLRREPEQTALQEQIDSLQKKYSVTLLKNVNAADIRPTDAIAKFGERQITYREFTDANRLRLADAAEHIYDDLQIALEDDVLYAMLALEAKERIVDASSILAAEVTNKLKTFEPEERLDLEDALRRRLIAKYAVRYVYNRPDPLVLNVSADDDPAFGPATAPVTVVMFSDFQCPACARTHPELKRVIAEYKDKVRFVVRDFPLENAHPNAFEAALAANAAHRQGKFVEYIEILYRNQEALDGASLRKYAEELKLDLAKFEAAMADPVAIAEIRKDQADGRAYGVAGTPTIFVNGVKVHRLSAPAFRDAIERALKK
ncbi:MAG: thioredoxin domain-containing protein [Acidobacteria bacterium]|nr:thioredoxin domain-containing protein [Acidobacteriota bacterium]